ncbi:MAG TPA: choice-of-anchor tandem repeat GloVer-containing protein [Verrucomicrobiae bacterium]|jgi:uncharacterized repeat protein (TIGR03803 family)|nr:choice-of-anchor tandem repeat GloVer-containing protein [Verrucomicrobiae bacterium]
MIKRIEKLLRLPALMAGLGVLAAAPAAAQNFKTLYTFTLATGVSSTGYSLNSDGRNPYGGLAIAGNTLAGTANSGGNFGWGTVFILNTDGTGFMPVHSFSMETYIASRGITTNSDGGNPQAALVATATALYGTTSQLGSGGCGTVFALSFATGFTNLHNFPTNVLVPNQTDTDYYTNSDGANPEAGLIISGNTLYGTAENGGLFGYGTVFRINTDGSGFTNLHSFTAIPYASTKNNDGANPIGGLVLSGSTLYGAAQNGGTNGWGTIFALKTNGTGFTNLYHFTDGSDGALPAAGLILSGNTLYGTTSYGGNSNNSGGGTVFAINITGDGFRPLQVFTARVNGTNGDGYSPRAGLVMLGNTLYGTASGGGTSDYGTVFAVNINGTGFETLHSFSAVFTNSTGVPTNSDGTYPFGTLILSSNTLFGTAAFGGTNGDGTLFSLPVLGPELSIAHSGTNVILTWPTNEPGFNLEYATNLVSPTIWNTNLPTPVVVNTNNTVTNPIASTRKFYRLYQ